MLLTRLLQLNRVVAASKREQWRVSKQPMAINNCIAVFNPEDHQLTVLDVMTLVST
jgi:hypothetical protein